MVEAAGTLTTDCVGDAGRENLPAKFILGSLFDLVKVPAVQKDRLLLLYWGTS